MIRWAWLSVAVLTLSLVLASMPACGWIDRMSGVAQARELKANGLPAQATVLKIWDTGMTVNNDPVIGLEVEVELPGGTPYVASIERALISRLDVPKFQPRAVILVRVDPNNPARVALDTYEYR